MKNIVYATFDGDFNSYKKIVNGNLCRWAAACPDNTTVELWLGPNMMLSANFGRLLHYIIENGVKDKFRLKDASHLISNTVDFLKKNKQGDLARKLAVAYEKSTIDVLGYYCNYGGYTDFVRYVALYYYLFVEGNCPLYIDAPDIFLYPNSKNFMEYAKLSAGNISVNNIKRDASYKNHLKKLFKNKGKFGIQIGHKYTARGTIFTNCVFYITDKVFAEKLLNKIIEEYNPYLLEIIAKKKPDLSLDFSRKKHIDPNELLLDSYSGYYIKPAKTSGLASTWTEGNIYDYTILNSGPSFIEKIVKEYYKNKYQKLKDQKLDDFTFELEFTIKEKLSWITKGETNHPYRRLPRSNYTSLDHFLTNLVKSTIILAKYRKMLPISYYFAIISLYITDQGKTQKQLSDTQYSLLLKKHMTSYLNELLKKQSDLRKIKNIKILGIEWLKYAIPAINTHILRSKSVSRKNFLKKTKGCLERTLPIANVFFGDTKTNNLQNCIDVIGRSLSKINRLKNI